MKRSKYVLMAGLMSVMPLAGVAQMPEPTEGMQRLFADGKQLFGLHNYAAAHQTLTRYVEQDKTLHYACEAEYMIACAAYELGMPQRVEQLEAYLGKYPETRYAARVRSLIASAAFFDGDYDKAIENYARCNFDALGKEESEDNIYRLAQSYMKTSNFKEASAWLKALQAVGSKYDDDATYNLACIDYVNGQYDDALVGFRRVEGKSKYAALAPYYTADINLIRGNDANARSIAERYLDAHPSHENSLQMKRIAGEAAYRQKDYAAAVRYLEDYRTEEAKPSRNALYKLGMSYFHTQVYSKAAACLGETTTITDEMTQNAYLNMGLSYLQLKERNQARMAFEQASRFDANRSIKEQALYNYALCIHETSYSAFAESVTVFERFLNEFPSSVYADRVNNYLVEVYMNTRSYEAALKSIEKITRPGSRILEAKQKLLFRMGTQAFAQARFDSAIDYFSQSLQLSRYNALTKADAYFWRGESKFRLKQYASAANDFCLYMEFAPDSKSREYGLALYNMGYTFFKQKKYDSALLWFNRCVQWGGNMDATVVGDAFNRAGDCYFYERRFDEAASLYAKAVAVEPSLGDYSLFQEGFVKGLQRNYPAKIETLNTLLSKYPSSQYIDDALYEQGRAFVLMEQSDNAIGRYKLLVEHYPDSPLSRKAAGEIGLLYYQNDRYNEAISAYKNVISSYPGSEEARMAQRDLKSIYIDLNKVDEFMAYAASLPGGVSFNVNERDSLTYTAAERVYMRGNIQEAKSSFVNYLQSFPGGAFGVNSNYYLGIIAYNEKDYAAAATYLGRVVEYPDSKFSAEALSLCASMAYSGKDYEKALSLYKVLADKSASQESRIEAETGAMRSAKMMGDTKEIISTSSALLANAKLMPEIMNEALYYRAKALIQSGQNAKAMADLKSLAKDTRNVYGAEAKYLVAQMYFDEGKVKEAEKEVLEYIEVSTPHAYWLARGFVLLSDVYVGLGRNLEAKQYLLSLQQNYQADDDIAGMIETRLSKLNTQQQ